MNDDKYYLKMYRKMIDKLHDEILGENWYIVDPVNGIQADEIIVNEVINTYKHMEKDNNNSHMSIIILLFIIIILLLAIICIL